MALHELLQRILMVVIRLSLIAAIVVGPLVGEWDASGLSLLALIDAYAIPMFIERRYQVTLPLEFHFVILVFIFSSLFLGTILGAYRLLWWWDIILHGASGVILGFAGFITLYTLRSQHRIRVSDRLVAIFALFVGMASGAAWEIWEFSLDTLFGMSIQKGNSDTMHDLVADTIGALLIAISVYIYLRSANHRRWSLLHRAVRKFRLHNPGRFAS